MANPGMPTHVSIIVTTEAVALPTAGQIEETADGRIARLFDTHHQGVYRLARRLSSNGDDARDLVQETFLRAARSPASLPHGAGPEEAWLVRVLVNVCRDGWRKRSTRARLHGLMAIAPLPAADPERALVARRTVWAALDLLPPRFDSAVQIDFNLRDRRQGFEGIAARAGRAQTPTVRILKQPGRVIDTSFTMDVGETVVVGTSRLEGDKALIVLLTAVRK